MSFTFTARGQSKAALMLDLNEGYDTVQQSQPAHSVDRHVLMNAASAQLELMNEPVAGHELVANVSGSMSWRDDEGGRVFLGMAVSCNIYQRHLE